MAAIVGLGLGGAALAAPLAADQEAIRAARARSNQAILARRYADIRSLLAPGYTVTPGSTGTPVAAEDAAVRMQGQFKDPSFIAYVRTPDQVRVGETRQRAAETGTWVGSWTRPDGIMKLTGVYQATWVLIAGEWRLLNEAFVTLGCSGSKDCAAAM